MTNSRSSAGSGSGCFSGIARLLLCKGSLQTHPADQIASPNTAEFDLVSTYQKNEVSVKLGSETATAAAAAAPGVVAKLMGLDSLPDTNWVPKGRTPDSVTRSRSVNFMDYLLEYDLAQAKHRRVRTSVSFREVPALLNQQNQHDFFVLYLDNMEKTKKPGSKLRKSEVDLDEEIKQQKKEDQKGKNKVINNIPAREAGMKKNEKNQRKILNISNLKGEPRKISKNKQSFRLGSCKGAQEKSLGFVSPRKKDGISKAKSPVKPMNQKEVLVESKFMKKIKNQHAIKDAQSDCSSEDSSPVSVLDLDEFSFHDLAYLSDYTSPQKPNYAFPQASRSWSPGDDAKYCTEVVRKLSRLTEEDIEESNWLGKNFCKLASSEEICIEFTGQILELLVKQVAEELVGLHMENVR